MKVPLVVMLLLARMGIPAHLGGLATYYDDRFGVWMRNGERLDLAGATVAVDDSEWEWLQGRQLVVVTECGRWVIVRVTDTGMLYDAGRFGWAVGPLEVARYWPVETLEMAGIEFEGSWAVVLDFPEGFYRERINCAERGVETTRVAAWVLN